MDLNRVQLIGRLGKDADTRQVRDTQKVSFSVATNENWQDEAGVWQKKTQWHSCVVWGGKLAEVAATLETGSHVFVEGKLAKREYEREVPAGKKTVKTPVEVVEIVVSKIVKLGRVGKGDTKDGNAAIDDSEVQ